jgi:hypothetical protein
MNAVLLTGAGFSHNWGGRLAREINTAVAMRLEQDSHLADLLHRNPNFRRGANRGSKRSGYFRSPRCHRETSKIRGRDCRRVCRDEQESWSCLF